MDASFGKYFIGHRFLLGGYIIESGELMMLMTMMINGGRAGCK